MNPKFAKVVVLGSIVGLAAHSAAHGVLIASPASDDQTQGSQDFGEAFGITAMQTAASGFSGTMIDVNPTHYERVYFDNSVHFGIERNKMPEVLKF